MNVLPAAALVLLSLAACTSTPTLRYPVPEIAPTEKIAIGVGTVEVRDVRLPLYAELEAITLQSPTGEILTDDHQLWADDPTRAVTQNLAEALSVLTNAKVAAEPWPLSESADARVEVRFSRALAGADGQYRMSGQYFVSFPQGTRREVARRFDLAAPFTPGSPNAIAAAQGQAVIDLARLIARGGL